MADPSLYQTRACSHCGRPVTRLSSHFSKGTTGSLAGKVFCDRECQKRMFRATIRCTWPGCAGERLIEGAAWRRKQCKQFLCDEHTDLLERGTGFRKFTQSRRDWLNDLPIGHRHLTSIFYRWSVFVLRGEKCALCGVPLSFNAKCNIDHRISVASGGETRLSNMQPLCVPCHKAKSSEEQRLVNRRRWAGRGISDARLLTHHEKDKLIAELRAEITALKRSVSMAPT